MKSTRLLLLASLLAGSGLHAQTSQTQLRGSVQGRSDSHPIEFANVLLRRTADSTLVTGSVTDSLGHFRLQAARGKYLLEVRSVGYKSLYRTLTLQGATQDLGKLLLEEESSRLREVQVAGKRPLIQRRADRLIFDPTQLAPGSSTALDILRQTPGLVVSDNDVSIVGKGSVIVLVNDKRVRLSGQALVNYLRSFAPANLEKVEVITSPPSKYEAEGNAGILNIVLKKEHNDYFGGTVSTGFSITQGHPGYNLSTGLNYQKGKLTSSLQLYHGGYKGQQEIETQRTYTSTDRYQSSISNSMWNGHFNGFELALDYSLNPTLSIGGSASLNVNNTEMPRENTTTTSILSTGDLISRTPASAVASEKSTYSSANVHLVKTFAGTPGQKLTWDVDYVGYRHPNTEQFQDEITPGSSSTDAPFSYHSSLLQRTSTYLTNIDYTQPLGQTMLGFGVKGTWTRTHNEVNYNFGLGDKRNQDTHQVFDEHIYAAYVDLQHQLSEKWSLREGLRLEYTHTSSKLLGQDALYTNNYLNLFPTLHLGYTPSQKHAWSLSGNVRIQRPHFGELVPYDQYENAYSIIRGKQDLLGAKTSEVKLGYTFMGFLSVESGVMYGWDGISMVPEFNTETMQTILRRDNAVTSLDWRLSNSAYITNIPFMMIYLQHELVYTSSRLRFSQVEETLSKRLHYNAEGNVRIFFNKQKTLVATLTASYNSPSVEMGYHSYSDARLHGGVSYKLLRNKLTLGFSTYNLLASTSKAYTETGGNRIMILNRPTQGFNFSATYNFGAALQGKEKSQNATDMRSRM